MSQRVKKPGRPDESQGKRRRRRPTGSDADEDGTRSGSNSGGNGSQSGGVWTPRNLGDLKVASIYNRNSAEAPAELYRKDLISAMKLPDSEPLMPEEYWLITDAWKQEWEKGVQVPVNPESLPESQVVVISPVADRSHDFRLPKKKYVRVTHDDFFNPDYHQLVSTAARAEKVCSYDLDDVDAAWLGCANSDRVMQILPVISEFLMEQVIEELELQCWEQVQTILKSQEGLGIEYDENVICDVCRSPESEEGNEMVFCDSCNICVHQACYGITSIPSGSFLCRTCTLGIRPSCILCPNMGGAMKATRSGHKWAHVACAIWIPEVSIGSVEKMEPITKISAIPQSRWSLSCVICKEKGGACIQCSVKTCKTAYHVTCAFKNGLEMKPIIVDENAEDGIKLRSYCEKHSVNTKKDKAAHSGSEDDGEKKKSRAMTAEERNQARAEKLQQIESEFFKYVRLKDVSQNLAVDMDIVNLIYNYWKLKRKSLNNRPLVPPRPETTQLLTQQQEQDLEQMKMFVQLRQDLERVRNLCYMVSRREKLSRSYCRLREQAFQKQVTLLSDKSLDSVSGAERAAILDANHGPSIYDQVYSQPGTKSNYLDYESLVTLIGGDSRPDLVNGALKAPKGSRGKANENPYKRTFVNGARRRSESLSSLSETELSVKGASGGGVKSVRKPLAYLFDTDSSMDAVIMTNSVKASKAVVKRKERKGPPPMSPRSGSTSESELDLPNSANKSKGRGKQRPIYSDSESEAAPLPKKLNAALMVTKGALKEFSKKGTPKLPVSPSPTVLPISKSTIRVSPLLSKGEDSPALVLKKRGRIPGKKKKALDPFEATEMIVPQREAAKKASESIRSVKKGKEFGSAEGGGSESPTNPAPPPQSKEIKPEVKDFGVDKARRKSSVAERKLSVVDFKPDRKMSAVEFKPIVTADRKGSVLDRKVSVFDALQRKSSALPEGTSIRRITVPEVEMLPKVEKRGSVAAGNSSDLEEDPAGAVSIVPQRQAAKKAAEHIRSCQSNVVAARLIIEDEMEASRKKSKLERANSKLAKSAAATFEKSPTRGRPSNASLMARDLMSAADPTATAVGTERRTSHGKVGGGKEKSPLKGNVTPRGRSPTKLSRKDSAPVKEEPKGADWPFLDKGSQSACRRSRERSSSSSTTSSGTSSTSDSSSSSYSSSSRSSSPGSASPVRPPPPTTSPLPSAPSGPGKKLKTSERLPAASRDSPKPLPSQQPKATGPKKPGPRRGTPPSIRTPSPAEPIRVRGADPSGSPGKRPPKPQPTSAKPKAAEEKVGELKSNGGQENETPTVTVGHGPPRLEPKKTSPQGRARPPPKSTPVIRDELALSSDSDEEGRAKEAELAVKSRAKPSANSLPELKRRPMPKTKKRELGLLSEDSGGSADEKENEKRVVASSPPAEIADSAPRKAQTDTVPAPAPPPLSMLSPLMPRCLSPLPEPKSSRKSSEAQKEPPPRKELEIQLEPEAKRPRIDTPPREIQIQTTVHSTHPPPVSSSPQLSISIVQSQAPTVTVPTVSTVNSLPSVPSMPRSIFSPVATVGSKESDLFDFDNDLYDLARSVTADCVKDREAGDAGRRESLSAFSFSQVLLGREDNKEESAQATINLVEKLRLQQKQKSSGPSRTVQDPEFDELTSEEPPPKPSPPPQPVVTAAVNSNQQPTVITIEDTPPLRADKPPEVERSESICDLTKSANEPISRNTPDRTKSLTEEERWIQNFPAHAGTHGLFGNKLETVAKESESNRFSPKIMPLHNQNFLPPLMMHGQGQGQHGSAQGQHGQGQGQHGAGQGQHGLPQGQMFKDDGLGIMIQSGKDSIDRLLSMQSHHLGLLMEVPDSRQNLVSMATVQNNLMNMTTVNSPSLPPGINLPPGLTATYSGTVIPPPPPPSFQGFMPYQMNSTLANVVTSLASGNLPFFHPHNQAPPPQHSKPLAIPSPLSSPPVVSNSFALGFAHHFNMAPPPQHGLQQQHGHGAGGSMEPPPLSPSEMSGRRRSDSASNSLAVVTSGMPPLSKPPLTSPSLLLASNNSMAAPPPPPQSTVAQIIESVIQASNNHPPNNMNQIKSFGANNATESFPYRLNPYQMLSPDNSSCSNLPSNNSPLPSPKAKHGVVPTVVSNSDSPLSGTVSEFNSVLSNKTNENIPQQKVTPREFQTVNAPVVTAVSPKGPGRGRRPTTPKVKVDKFPAEEASPKGRGKGERKSSGASPGRGAKGSTTPRRGGGRGKGKGKNVLVRKDLAGTVYDIDLDEFEENAEDKLDLRSLRDRRKSNDAGECRKSESSEESSPPIRVEKNSPRQKVHGEGDGGSQSCRQRSSSGMLPPLITPVDMRTFNPAMPDIDLYDAVRKSSSAIEFASLMLGSDCTTVAASVREIDELDKTLEALTGLSPVKSHISMTPAAAVNNLLSVAPCPKITSQNPNLGGGESSSKESYISTLSEDNHSRNQLKVKIKGPFLDANYSSNAVSAQPYTGGPSVSLQEPFAMNSTPMMNNPLNLRRMRKKELLRQYCNQDMNTDGRYPNATFGGEYVGGAHAHFHPYGRAVITIPKAVASMEIIPSGKDDYGLEAGDLCPLPPPPPPIQEKKKRNRGVNREMAALGLIEIVKGDRHRTAVHPMEVNSRKKVRTAVKPSRSAFVPPTLAEDGAGSAGGSLAPSNHPTPKLKIKFSDFNSSVATCSSAGSTNSNASETNHVGSKVKGRPPKKRGIAEVSTVPPPPPMEELKRQSLMFAEKVMKDFADDENGGKSSKKKKKSKKSKRNDNDSNSKSEVKIITENVGGPKLILRFGKNRSSSSTGAGSGEVTLNNNTEGAKNGPSPASVPTEIAEKAAIPEGDSGFTGSSEGSGGSWTPSISVKKFSASMSGVLKSASPSPKANHRKSEDSGGGATVPGGGVLKESEALLSPGDSGIEAAVLKFKTVTADGVTASTSNSVTGTTASPTLSKGPMPIRLKLHRCYEGYATTKEVDRENTNPLPNPKQSDSCEVR